MAAEYSWDSIGRLFRSLLGCVRQLSAFHQIPSVAQSPITVVGLLVLFFVAVSVGSRGYQVSRWMLDVRYPDPSRLVLISETGVMMGQQMGVSPALVEFWQSHATKLSGIAGYRWDRDGNGY